MENLVVFVAFFLLFRFSTASTNITLLNNCTQSKETFSKYVAEFTSCAIINSRPITLCESCVDTYISVIESYDNLTKFSDNQDICIKKLVNLDRLEILLTLYKNTNDLWSKAKCFECFVIQNGRLTHNRSENMIRFNKLYNDTIKCINTTNGDPDVMCPKCLDTYLKLNDYYIDMINENDKIAGCMDIVDLMNSTRSSWSEKCCKSRKHNETIFLVSTGSMFLIAILFYILVKMCTDMKKPAIFKQSRLSESLARIN